MVVADLAVAANRGDLAKYLVELVEMLVVVQSAPVRGRKLVRRLPR